MLCHFSKQGVLTTIYTIGVLSFGIFGCTYDSFSEGAGGKWSTQAGVSLLRWEKSGAGITGVRYLILEIPTNGMNHGALLHWGAGGGSANTWGDQSMVHEACAVDLFVIRFCLRNCDIAHIDPANCGQHTHQVGI